MQGQNLSFSGTGSVGFNPTASASNDPSMQTITFDPNQTYSANPALGSYTFVYNGTTYTNSTSSSIVLNLKFQGPVVSVPNQVNGSVGFQANVTMPFTMTGTISVLNSNAQAVVSVSISGSGKLVAGVLVGNSGGSGIDIGVANYTFTSSIDSTTQGAWSGKYGTDGYLLANGPSKMPTYGSVFVSNASTYTWAGQTNDPRALQNPPGSNTGLAAAFTQYPNTPFNVNIILNDALPHQIALYLLDWDSTTRGETITVTDSRTNAVLSTQHYSGFNTGVYALFTLTGSAVLKITPDAGTTPVLSGIFFDPAAAAAQPNFTLSATPATIINNGTTTSTVTVTPTGGFNSPVTLAATNWAAAGFSGTFVTNPTTGTSIVTINSNSFLPPIAYPLTVTGTSGSLTATTTIQVTVLPLTLSATPLTLQAGGATASSTLTIGNNNWPCLIGAITTPTGVTLTSRINNTPYATSAVLSFQAASTVAAGQYSIIAGLTCSTSSFTTTIPVTVTGSTTAPGSSASYVSTDISTQGAWNGKYGADGYLIANLPASLPAYAAVSVTGASTYTWSNSTTDPRALQGGKGSTTGYASGYSAYPSFNINVNLTDGNTHQVALYLLDWDTTSRVESITVLDAATNAVLDQESYTGFHNGQWAVWNVKGNVIFKVATTNPSGNAIFSGIFFGPAAGTQPAPSFTLTAIRGFGGLNPPFIMSVIPVNGFSSPVTFSTPNWPAGIVGTFTVNPTTNNSSDLYIGAGVGVAPALYTLTINGSGGGVTASTSVQLQVYPPLPSFTLSQNTVATIAAGSSGTSTVMVIPVNGFSAPVTLSTSLWPAGITGTFSPNPVTSQNLTSTVTINVPSSVTPGGYNLYVFGDSGSGNSFGQIYLTVTANPGPGTSATFAGFDTTTQGAWSGTYGTAGYTIANGASVAPAYGFATVNGALTYTWVGQTTDPRALQALPGAANHIASAYTQYANNSFTVSVNLLDTNVHKISLYLLDWDTTSRTETITVMDAATNAVLDTQTVTGFHNGQYASWNVKGNVIIKVTPASGVSPVLSGIFFN